MKHQILVPPFKGDGPLFNEVIWTVHDRLKCDEAALGDFVTAMPVIGRDTIPALEQMRHREGVFSLFSNVHLIRTHDAISFYHYSGTQMCRQPLPESDRLGWGVFVEEEWGRRFTPLQGVREYLGNSPSIVELEEVRVVSNSCGGIWQTAIEKGLMRKINTFGDVLTVYEVSEADDKLVLMMRNKVLPARYGEPIAFLIEGIEIHPVY